MSDCPECKEEVKVEEVKAEEVKVEETAAKPADSPAVKILKSVGRVVGLTAILAAILFVVLQDNIYRYCYEQRYSSKVENMIKDQVKAGLGDSGFTFTVEYIPYSEENQNGNYYKVVVNDGKIDRDFAMCGLYNTEKSELTIICLGEDENPHCQDLNTWKSIQKFAQKKAAKKAAPAPEAPAETPAATTETK